MMASFLFVVLVPGVVAQQPNTASTAIPGQATNNVVANLDESAWNPSTRRTVLLCVLGWNITLCAQRHR